MVLLVVVAVVSVSLSAKVQASNVRMQLAILSPEAFVQRAAYNNNTQSFQLALNGSALVRSTLFAPSVLLPSRLDISGSGISQILDISQLPPGSPSFHLPPGRVWVMAL